MQRQDLGGFLAWPVFIYLLQQQQQQQRRTVGQKGRQAARLPGRPTDVGGGGEINEVSRVVLECTRKGATEAKVGERGRRGDTTKCEEE